MNATCPAPGIFGTCLTRLTTGQAVGLSVDVETGLLSTLSVLAFLSLVSRNVIRHYRNPPPGGWNLLRTHIDAYILCLLTFELIHGFAAIMSIKWIHEGEVFCGSYCTVQGAMRNAGSTGVALVTLVIAIHTFSVIFFQWIPPRSLFVPFVVLFTIISSLIAYLSYEITTPRPREDSFFAPTPYWCWIGPGHSAARIWGQYLWLWLAALISILLYVPLYFCVKGNLLYRPHSRWKFHISRVPRPQEDAPLQTNAAKVATTDAMCMLYYPAAYVLLILPLSIVRWMSASWQSHDKHFPFAPTVTGSALFGLSGLVNVLLFVMTRPNLLLFRSNVPPSPSRVYHKTHRPPPGYPSSPPSSGRSIESLLNAARSQGTPLHDFQVA